VSTRGPAPLSNACQDAASEVKNEPWVLPTSVSRCHKTDKVHIDWMFSASAPVFLWKRRSNERWRGRRGRSWVRDLFQECSVTQSVLCVSVVVFSAYAQHWMMLDPVFALLPTCLQHAHTHTHTHTHTLWHIHQHIVSRLFTLLIHSQDATCAQ